MDCTLEEGLDPIDNDHQGIGRREPEHVVEEILR